MRSINVRALESTPGQLYCRRSEPAIIKTRNGRFSGGSLPFSSLGFIVFECWYCLSAECSFPMQQQRDAGRGDFIGARTLQLDVPVARRVPLAAGSHEYRFVADGVANSLNRWPIAHGNVSPQTEIETPPEYPATCSVLIIAVNKNHEPYLQNHPCSSDA